MLMNIFFPYPYKVLGKRRFFGFLFDSFVRLQKDLWRLLRGKGGGEEGILWDSVWLFVVRVNQYLLVTVPKQLFWQYDALHAPAINQFDSTLNTSERIHGNPYELEPVSQSFRLLVSVSRLFSIGFQSVIPLRFHFKGMRVRMEEFRWVHKQLK